MRDGCVKKRAGDEKGLMSVEAILFVSIFLIFFVCMVNIMRLVMTQTIIQTALNQTAKEYSQYSYILTKAGVKDNMENNAAGADRIIGNTTDVVNSLMSFTSSVNGLMNNLSDPSAYSDVYNSANGTYNTTSDYIDYLSDDGFDDAIKLGKDYARQWVGRFAAYGMLKSSVDAHLDMLVPGGDADALLKNMGVNGGVGGISVNSSLFGVDDIVLVATYTINYKVPFIELEPYQITLRAATGRW